LVLILVWGVALRLCKAVICTLLVQGLNTYSPQRTQVLTQAHGKTLDERTISSYCSGFNSSRFPALEAGFTKPMQAPCQGLKP